MSAKEPNSNIPNLSLDHLSKIIGRKVTSYTITPGTAPGDNYLSVLYCLTCVLENGEVLHAISKNYHPNPSRQEFLNKSNTFWNELVRYKNLLPILDGFLKEVGGKFKLPFAPLISGEAIDFGTDGVNDERLAQYAGKVFDPFDIYILMVDLKKTYGFRLANRFLGLTLDEVSLVINEYAKVHALSHAYKLKNRGNPLSSKFPFLESRNNENYVSTFVKVTKASMETALQTLKSVDGLNPAILAGMEKFDAALEDVMKYMFYEKDSPPVTRLESFLRVKMNKTDETWRADDVPWSVIVHGDCWVNNFLFRYDKDTQKAIEVVLIDLQIMREGCPTSDLAHLMYSSTTTEFRQHYMKDMLKLYHSKFMSYCDELGVDYLPGYSLAALKRRFHAAKLLGLAIAVIVLPVITRESKDVDEEEGFDSVVRGNDLYKIKLLAVVQELYEDGVL